MADTTALKNRIRAAIKANDNQEITGPVLQQILLDIVDELDLYPELENEADLRQQRDTQLNNLITGIKNNIDNGYVYAGIATPSTVPVSGKVFYVAVQAGTYVNFSNKAVTEGITILKYDGGPSWVKEQALFTDGGVFDITAYNDNTKYADITAALNSGNNIPQSLHKGGISVKFVRISDSKYVQCRLTKDSWSIDIEDWVIADEGVCAENPEFIYVKADNEGKVLWAIKTDGGIYYGAGVPQQIIDYIEEKLADLSLDEYEDIVAFLNGLEEGDKTLQTLLNEKVDKEEGKSLIDAEYASSQSAIENPEFLEVATDLEDKVLEGIQADGTKVIGGDLNVGGSASVRRDIRVLGSMEVSGVSYKVIKSPEYLAAWIDAKDNVIFGLKTDGKTFVGDATFLDDLKKIKEFLPALPIKIDWDALSIFTIRDNPEYLNIEADAEGKILSSRNADGVKKEHVGFETPKVSISGHTMDNIKDPEGRSEVTTDAEGKIISYRDSEGVKHENAGIETKTVNTKNLNAININYSDKNLIDLANALKEAGLSSSYDLRLPQVRVTSDLLTVDGNNIIGLDLTKNEVDCLITFISPNKSFAEEGKIAYQGNSTLYNVKKGFSVDFTNKHRFKNWVEMDGFHLKAYYLYNLRIRDVASNRLIERIYKQRASGTNRPYNTYNDFGPNSIYNRIDGGALCHVDSFPVELYINDSYWGLYFFNIKKSRSNYLLTKKNVHHIQVEAANDAYYTNEWFADGGQGWGVIPGTNTEYIEIRNPNKDSGNSSFELGVEPNAGEVKTAWQDFIGRLNAITTNTTVEQLQQFLNVREWVDYIIISQLIYHSDNWCKNTLYTTWDCVVTNGAVAAHWSPLLYDMDQCIHANIGQDPFAQKAYEKCPWLSTLMEVLDTNIKQRYAELRNDKTVDEFTMKNILEELFLEIGYDVYSDEVKRWNDGGVMDSMSGIVSAFNDRVSYLDTLWDYSNNN